MDHSSLSILILSGLSGAGKSVALKALEDVGYFCIDNLPAPLMKPLLDTLRERRNTPLVAVGLDIREQDFLAEASLVLSQLRRHFSIEILFLEAEEEVMIRRYRETRRPHPMVALGASGSLVEALRHEKAVLTSIRSDADRIIDTSNYNPHQLRLLMQSIFGDTQKKPGLRLTLMSFGFKYGVPNNIDMLFDARILANPHFEPSLRALKGIDQAVSQFVLEREDTKNFISIIYELFSFAIPRCKEEGRSYLTIAIGCTGGRHRSPALVERIAKELPERFDLEPQIIHRDMEYE